MAKADSPTALEIDALLTGGTSGDDEAIWTELVRAADSGDRWRRAQVIRGRLDRVVDLTGRFPWLVAPWVAIRATRRLVSAGLPVVIAGDLPRLAPAGLGVLRPADDGGGPADRSIELQWGQVVELSLAVGTTIDVRVPAGARVAPEWRSNHHPEPVPAPRWKLEPGEAPVLVTVELNGACAGLVILEAEP
jgi:hypothetical protein